MASRSYIPTPPAVRWQRVRYRILPIVTVILCTVLAWRLWHQQVPASMAVGEVDTQREEVTSPQGGVLVRLGGKQLKLHDPVTRGQVVAKIRPAVHAPTTGPAAVAKSSPEDDSGGGDEEVTTIKAPMTGQVIAIHRRAGEAVMPGEAILTIASASGRTLTTYLRPAQRIRAVPGMEAELRLRSDPSKPVKGFVERVGAEVVEVSEKQLRDQKVKEWGLPVTISLPVDLAAHPGELVDVNFQPAPASPAAPARTAASSPN